MRKKKPAEINSAGPFVYKKQKGKGRGETGGRAYGETKSSPYLKQPKLMSCFISIMYEIKYLYTF